MDQCVHCVHKGNLDSCRNEDCGFHTLWFHLADKEAAVKEKEIYIHQLRGALGYPVPGDTPSNLDIHNGIAEALHKQIAALTGDVKKWIRVAGENQKSANLSAKTLDELTAENKRLREEIERLREALEGIYGRLAMGSTIRERDSFAIAQDALRGRDYGRDK